MFSRLLVGLDGSAGTDAALDAAIELGRQFRSTVVLAAVADIGLLEAPLLATGAALADAPVSPAVVAGLAEERFLILPHPEVAEFFQRKASDHDRWLSGMRRLQAAIQEGHES